MRSTLILSLAGLLAFGCGPAEQGSDVARGLGSILTPISTPVDPAVQTRAQLLCQLLAEKETNLRSRYLTDFHTFNFSTSLRNCQGVTQTSQVKARIRSSAGKLEYQVLSGSYHSTAVETAQLGQLAVLCTAELTRTLRLSETAMADYQLSPGPTCGAGSNEICVTLRTAFKQSSGAYQIQMIDDFVVNAAGTGLRGMVLRHSRYDLANCTEGASVLNVSSFTGVSNE